MTERLSFLEPLIVNYPPINWRLLAQSQQYYTNLGYEYCETPYALPELYSAKTKPHNDPSFILSHGFFENQPHELVGSAEQGFIYLWLTQQLPNKKLCSITPCFRTENYNSTTHLPWFMKCELFHLSDSLEDCHLMIQDAWNFYIQHTNENSLTLIQTSDESWDINLYDIEIASFGIRRFSEGAFIYGTGLALPRFSFALSCQNRL
jgi:hypothetical protein